MLCVIALSIPLAFFRMIWSVGRKRKLQNLRQNAVPPSPDRAMVGMAQENRTGINLIRAVGTATRKLIDRLLPLKTQKSQPGAPLEAIVTTGVGVEVAPQEVITPRPSKGITKNDNYCATSVQTVCLKDTKCSVCSKCSCE